MALAEKYAWASPNAVLDETPFTRLYPFLLSPQNKKNNRLIPLDQMPPGTREEVINRTRARRGLPPIKPKVKNGDKRKHSGGGPVH